MQGILQRILVSLRNKLVWLLRKSAIDVLWDRSIDESADYLDQFSSSAMFFLTNKESLKYALSKRPADGLVIEFGVGKAGTLNIIASQVSDQTVYGFDCFTGLTQDWPGTHLPAGSYTNKGRLPRTRRNCHIITGRIEDTLPGFLIEHKQNISFMHIDTDTYDICRLILETLMERIVKGTVIEFDEYHSYPGWRFGEFKAFREFCNTYGVKYAYLCFSPGAAAIQVQ